jgi:hypothetical protein
MDPQRSLADGPRQRPTQHPVVLRRVVGVEVRLVDRGHRDPGFEGRVDVPVRRAGARRRVAALFDPAAAVLEQGLVPNRGVAALVESQHHRLRRPHGQPQRHHGAARAARREPRLRCGRRARPRRAPPTSRKRSGGTAPAARRDGWANPRGTRQPPSPRTRRGRGVPPPRGGHRRRATPGQAGPSGAPWGRRLARARANAGTEQRKEVRGPHSAATPCFASAASAFFTAASGLAEPNTTPSSKVPIPTWMPITSPAALSTGPPTLPTRSGLPSNS